MAKNPAGTVRLQIWVALKTRAFLELLAQKGTHGVNGPDVAKSFIERGIQTAIKDGGLTPEDIRAVEQRK